MRILSITISRIVVLIESPFKLNKEFNAPFAIITRANGSGTVTSSGPFGTVPELLFEKKGLIPALQQLLVLGQMDEVIRRGVHNELIDGGANRESGNKRTRQCNPKEYDKDVLGGLDYTYHVH